MADDLIHGGICGDTWWNNSCTSRNMFGSSSFCSSSTISDLGGAFGWSNISLFDDIKTTTTSTDASLLLHQDVLNVINDSLDSTNTSEWNEALLQTNGSSHQGSYQIMLQDDFKLDINNNYHQQPNNVMDFCPSTYGSDQESSNNTNYTLNPSASTDHSTFLHNIFLDNNTTMQEPLFENHQAANFTSSATTCSMDNSFMNMNDFSLMKQPPLAFSNDKSSTMKAGLLPSTQLQAPLTSSVGDKYNRPKAATAKSNIGAGAKKTNDETPFKRPRLETPSHLPTFKVRKEKLGDRITALQQLVSPFGKTDTASVLHEAIEYIKFLHDKVNVMSTPYMKNGPASQRQQGLDEQDLRSRGLCIVPLSSTFSLDAQPPTDFWAPTLGGPFRNDQFEEWNGGSHIDLPCSF